MRVLIAPFPVLSHITSVVPIAWALQNAGHQILVTVQPGVVDTVTGHGLVAAAHGTDLDLAGMAQASPTQEHHEIDALARGVVDSLRIGDDDPVVRGSIEHLVVPGMAVFLGGAAGRDLVAAVADLCRRWRPDLVLWDSGYFPAGAAAHAAGIPNVRLLWGRDWFGFLRRRLRELRADDAGVPDLLADWLRPVLAGSGIAFAEEILLGDATIDPQPEILRLPADVDYLPVRWTPYTGPGPVPPWVHRDAPGPRICVSLGLSYREYLSDADLAVTDVLLRLAGLGAEVVATVDARQVPPDVELPPNVRLVDFVPLSDLLGTCSAVVHHGGTGTWAAALAHEVPQVVVSRPQIDYPAFGELVESAGAGLHITAGGDAGSVADAVTAATARVLGEPSFAEGAAALRAAVSSAPSPAELAESLAVVAGSRSAAGRAV